MDDDEKEEVLQPQYGMACVDVADEKGEHAEWRDVSHEACELCWREKDWMMAPSSSGASGLFHKDHHYDYAPSRRL